MASRWQCSSAPLGARAATAKSGDAAIGCGMPCRNLWPGGSSGAASPEAAGEAAVGACCLRAATMALARVSRGVEALVERAGCWARSAAMRAARAAR